MINKNILTIFFQITSLFGTPFFYVPMTAYFLKINPKLGIKLILILVINEFVCGAIKYIYPKDRPVPMPNKTLIQKYFAGSFPSVHTARITAFSVAIVLFTMNKIFILIGLLAIAGVGYSRIYLKKHYLIDVIAGFLIGAIISFAALFL
ncbi:MAG: phosphatase PAP2 family protein [Nanoarchaeota archaeon]|nr:phosphatase PAP2 family protein [Nanoarchaeota archaeon]